MPYLTTPRPTPWHKGKLTGQKPPLKIQHIWAVRIRLQMSGRLRDLALFNLAIDSKLRACDLVRIRVRDVDRGGRIVSLAQDPATVSSYDIVIAPLAYELTKPTEVAFWQFCQCVPDHWPAALLCCRHVHQRLPANIGWMR